MMQAHLNQVCNYDGAYAEGVNDAKSGEDMNLYTLGKCPADVREEAKRGYREGYTSAIQGGGTTVIAEVHDENPVSTPTAETTALAGLVPDSDTLTSDAIFLANTIKCLS